MTRPIRSLLFSGLYPSSVRPSHGIFVETRLRELLECGEVECRVVAPVPWFPSTNPRFGNRARLARTPRYERHHGIEVHHPRYLMLPKIGMYSQPLSMAVGALPTILQLRKHGFDFDLIDAHYFYPDGVAAALLSTWLDRPCLITARGSDVNLIPEYWLPRNMMRWAAKRSDALIGVSNALLESVRKWGIAFDRLQVIRNGVDLDRFRPVPQIEARTRLRIQGAPIFLSVGNLVELKGHHITIAAFAEVLADYPDARLVIIGDGPCQGKLLALAAQLGVGSRVLFVGILPQEDLFLWYSAADMSILASSREGWPNVLLESMACGTPVVASNVSGIPEVVGSSVVGQLAEQRTASAFSTLMRNMLLAPVNRRHVREYAERFSWDATTAAQLDVFRRVARHSQLQQ